MTDTRKAQLDVGVDASGAEQGFEKVKRAARGMADDVKNSGKEAAKGLDGIGDGADKGASKVDKATTSIIGSIQRTTAALAAGEKGTAKYYETLANQRGVSADVLKPYLEGLRAVEQAQGRVGVSAAQTAAAMRGVPAQMTDIITSLQGGQAPMTVLLQQGGQLKDMFGGVGNAAKALGGYVLGLVNPFTVAAAAVGTLGLAYYQGSKEAAAYNKALILSGNGVGATVGQLNQMAASMSRMGVSQGAAAEALAIFAQESKVGKNNLEEFSLSAIKFSRVTGQSVSEVAKQYAELAKDPLAASLKFNDSMNYLTESVQRQIKTLQEQGRATEAAALAQKAFADAGKDIDKNYEASLGALERKWISLGKSIAQAWNEVKGLGREGPSQELALIQNQIKSKQYGLESYKDTNAGQVVQKEIDALRAREAILQGILKTEKDTADLRASEAEKVKARADADKDGLKYLTERQRMERDIAQQRETLVRAGAGQVEIEQRIAQIKSSYAQKNLDGENEIAGIRAKIDATKEYIDRLKDLNLESPKLTEAENQSLKIQKELQGSITGVARAQKEKALAAAQELVGLEQTARATELWRERIKKAKEEYANMVLTLGKSADSINQQAAAQEAANAVFGKGTTAVAAYTLAELKRQMSEAQASDRFTPQYIASLDQKIKAQERFVESLKAADYKTLNAGLDEWLRSSNEAGKLYADEARLAGLTSLERAKVVAQRQVELQLATKLKDIDQSSINEADKETLRQKARDTAAVASATATAKAVQDEWTKVSDQINQSLTDALMRGFESGKGFLQNFADTIKNLFKTMILRPVIQAIVSPVSGAIALGLGASGVATAGTSATAGSSSLTALSGVSAVASLAKSVGLLGAGFKAGLSALTGEAGFAGAYSAGTTAIGAGNIAGGVGTLAGALAPVAAGLIAGKLISGGYSVIGSSGNVAVGSGAAIGALLGGPIGAGIGAALGGVVNRLFGRKLADTGVQGTFGGAAGFAGENYQFYKGGFFSSDKTTTSALDSQLQSGLSKQFLSLQSSTALMATTLGLGTDAIQNFTKDIKVSFQGLSADQINAKLQEQFTQLGEDLANQALGAAGQALVRDGETSATALTRLSSSLVSVNSVLDVLNKSLLATSLTGADAASQLVDLFGGQQGFQQSTSAYYDAYYSQAEKTAKTTQQVTNGLTALGYAMPATLSGFRALVDAQDLTTAAGRNTYAALIQLSPAFAEVANAATDAAKAITDQRDNLQAQLDQAQGNTAAIRARELAALDPSNRALQERIYLLEDEKAALAAAKTNTDNAFAAVQRAIAAEKQAVQARIDVAKQNISTLQSIFDTLKTSIADLYASTTATAQQGYQDSLDFITNALSAAKTTGYLPDNAQLQSAISTAKTGLGQQAYASAFEATRDRLVLAGQLSQLKDVTGDQLSAQETLLKTAEDQLKTLNDTMALAQQQLDALRGIDTSVLSVTAAMTALTTAISAERSLATAVSTATARPVVSASQAYMNANADVAAAFINNNYGKTLDEFVQYHYSHYGMNEQRLSPAQLLANLTAPKFAAGGLHMGGLRIVGENGPELEATGPARIFNADQTKAMLGGNSQALVAEIQALRADNQAQASAMVQLQARLTKLMERWDGDGMPETRSVTA